MGFRIDRIEGLVNDGIYRWVLHVKGLQGESVYGSVFTGPDGRGLLFMNNYGFSTFAATELLPPDRFHAHAECTAEDVVQRVAAVLVSIGWGPEYFNDRDSISGRREVRKQLTASKDDGSSQRLNAAR